MSTQSKAPRRAKNESSATTPVKRRPGRPRKSESGTPTAKTQTARQTRMAAKRAGTSTRELIIARANEIINRTGVDDLRIETLAQSLGLSHRNITYHSPKK